MAALDVHIPDAEETDSYYDTAVVAAPPVTAAPPPQPPRPPEAASAGFPHPVGPAVARAAVVPSPPAAPRAPPAVAPSPQPAAAGAQGKAVVASGKLTLLVSPKQKGNPILAFIRHVYWEFRELPAGDYCMGEGLIAVYLSLRFHALKPAYLPKRLAELTAAAAAGRQQQYKLRVLLVQVDVDDPTGPLQAVTRAALDAGCTVMCAFSLAEAARYLETYKAYEHKGAGAIQERVEAAYFPQVQDALTTVRAVNKTDVLTLLSRFGSLAAVLTASCDELLVCPGIGEKKVRRLHSTFTQPFLPAASVHPPRRAPAPALHAADPAVVADALLDAPDEPAAAAALATGDAGSAACGGETMAAAALTD